jgi:dihydrolipoamide dehydrogenase
VADLECDVVIIGAGTAGLSAERSARRAGARTLLVDPRFAGTTCASNGCMPSKLLIAAARSAHAVAAAENFGIRTGLARIDGKAVMARVRKLRDEFVSSTQSSIADLGQEARLMGTAKFVDVSTLDVDGQIVRARAVVIATGSRSAIPKEFQGLKNVLTNEMVFDLEDLPSSLAVIGAGPLGLELAQAFARLGVDVDVFDEGPTIAGLRDEAVGKSLHDILVAEMPIHLGVSVHSRAVGNAIEISWSGASEGRQTFSHVLLAAGRVPNLEALDLRRTGLELDKHGIPVFDRQTMRCGASPVFIAGDCDADVPVLHEATAEGAIAGLNAARYPDVEPSRRSTMLAITFTDPPSASVGRMPDADTVVGETNFRDQGRAKVEGRNNGLMRIYADKTGRLTGAAMAAPEAEHLAHLIAWAIEARQTAMDVLELPIYHPTFEEGLRGALRKICAATNVDLAADRDEGTAPGA